MQDVQIEKALAFAPAVERIDTTVRAVFGDKVTGLSSGPNGLTCHLTDVAGSGDLTLVGTILTAHNSLVVAQDVSTIVADGAETATITCEMADADFSYAAWHNGELFDSGTDTVVGGVATVELSTALAGEWLIEIRRTSDNYASGYATVTATEET